MNLSVRNKLSSVLMNDGSVSCAEMDQILELVDSMIPPELKSGQIWKGHNGKLVVLSTYPGGDQNIGYSYLGTNGISHVSPMRERYIRQEGWTLLFDPE